MRDILWLGNRNIKRSEAARPRKKKKKKENEAWVERGCKVFGRKLKGLLGCWQFLFIDLGGAYLGIYLEIIVMPYVFVLYTLLCVCSTSQ